MMLPEAVEQGEWACTERAQVRVRMTCPHGHTGQVMDLCAAHDEPVFSGEYVAGEFRQVKSVRRVPGHFEMIARRQAGFCPPCGWPDSRSSPNRVDYAALQKEWEGIGTSLHGLFYSPHPRAWYSSLAVSLRQRREDIGRMFEEARQLGITHNCPLTLVPVS
jgi:hypothetical protein